MIEHPSGFTLSQRTSTLFYIVMMCVKYVGCLQRAVVLLVWLVCFKTSDENFGRDSLIFPLKLPTPPSPPPSRNFILNYKGIPQKLYYNIPRILCDFTVC